MDTIFHKIKPGHNHLQSRHSGTRYINFDSSRCQACWECIKVCPNEVFGRIDILFHKHIIIIDNEKCKGCQKCLKVCTHGAITSKAVASY